MDNTNPHLRSHALLLLAAALWGLAFVFQKQADSAGLPPLLFNALRFTLGGLVLLPIVAWIHTRADQTASPETNTNPPRLSRPLFVCGILMGIALAAGSAFQQAGLGDEQTTAGKAGFITGLYVVLVPALGVLIGRRSHLGAWVGVGFALIGLFFLTINTSDDSFSIGRGDLLVLIGTAFWATHILMIDRFTTTHDALTLSVIQFFICAALSAVAGIVMGEHLTAHAITTGLTAILYCGVVAVAIAFTLQVVAQKNAHPTAAAIILSTEVVFAAIGGAVFLDEIMSNRHKLGAGLMLFGMVISQVLRPSGVEPAGNATIEPVSPDSRGER